MVYYCYLIQSLSNPQYTYIGTTNNISKRLDMHNGIIKGGAKATRRFSDWKYYIIVELLDKSTALSFEWKWKHYKTKNNKWLRTKSGIDNKVKRLYEIIDNYPSKITKIDKK